uniref:Uncharacterized protein n=1 Tax=Amicula sp. isolate GU52X-4 cfCalB7 TaxID=3003489 RepID=A0A9E8YZB1_9STRA|nr:hypothetical protein [Amicula sp. isolate GU52X-4 cfCalB7]
MTYNHERMLQLWPKRQKFRDLGLTPDNREFYEYRRRISESIDWTKKNKYFSIAEDFINNKINLYDYMLQFQFLINSTRYEKDQLLNDFNKLKNFNYNPASYGFNKVVGAFFEDWDLYDPTGPDEFDPDPDYPSDEEFRLSIKATFDKYHNSWKE